MPRLFENSVFPLKIDSAARVSKASIYLCGLEHRGIKQVKFLYNLARIFLAAHYPNLLEPNPVNPNSVEIKSLYFLNKFLIERGIQAQRLKSLTLSDYAQICDSAVMEIPSESKLVAFCSRELTPKSFAFGDCLLYASAIFALTKFNGNTISVVVDADKVKVFEGVARAYGLTDDQCKIIVSEQINALNKVEKILSATNEKCLILVPTCYTADPLPDFYSQLENVLSSEPNKFRTILNFNFETILADALITDNNNLNHGKVWEWLQLNVRMRTSLKNLELKPVYLPSETDILNAKLWNEQYQNPFLILINDTGSKPTKSLTKSRTVELITGLADKFSYAKFALVNPASKLNIKDFPESMQDNLIYFANNNPLISVEGIMSLPNNVMISTDSYPAHLFSAIKSCQGVIPNMITLFGEYGRVSPQTWLPYKSDYIQATAYKRVCELSMSEVVEVAVKKFVGYYSL